MRLSRELGGRRLARLVVVSNRVPCPSAGKRGAAGSPWRSRALKQRDAVVRLVRRHGWREAAARARDRHAQASPYATIDLSAEDYEGYYVGFANGALWPLLHYRARPHAISAARTIGAIWRVNRRFAQASAPLLRPDDVIWVHDYHLIPLAGELRSSGITSPHRLLPAYPVPAGRADRGAACARATCCTTSRPATWSASRPRETATTSCGSLSDLAGAQRSDGEFHLDRRTSRAVAVPVGIDPQRFARMSRAGGAQRPYAAPARQPARPAARSSAPTGSIIPRACRSASKPRRGCWRSIRSIGCNVTYLQIAARSREDVDGVSAAEAPSSIG